MQSVRKERKNFINMSNHRVTHIWLWRIFLGIWKDILQDVIKLSNCYKDNLFKFYIEIPQDNLDIFACHLSLLGTWQTFQKNLSNVMTETNEICTTIKFVKKKETYLFSINVSSSDLRRRKASLREEEQDDT